MKGLKSRCLIGTICVMAILGLVWKYNLISVISSSVVPTDVEVTVRTSSWFLLEEEMRQRKSRIQNVCSSQKMNLQIHTDARSRFLINRRRHIAMCYVAKAGCTLWKRIFLQLQEGQPKRSGEFWFSVPKKFIHSSHIDNLQAMTFDQVHQFLKLSKKILFVRHPFSRLFSAYVDKFVLSDFWNPVGRTIIRKIRPNSLPLSLKCGHDVTFNEFLKFVLTFRNGLSEGFAEHWLPVSKLCHPCLIDFDFIGKQESFGADLNFISTQLQFQDELPVNVTRDSAALSSMSQSVNLLWSNVLKSHRQCQISTNKLSILREAFIAQGFLSSRVEFPWTSDETVTMTEFLRFIQRIYKNQNLTGQAFHDRRRSALLTAYSSVSTETLDSIRQMFAMDFALFNYNPWP